MTVYVSNKKTGEIEHTLVNVLNWDEDGNITISAGAGQTTINYGDKYIITDVDPNQVEEVEEAKE